MSMFAIVTDPGNPTYEQVTRLGERDYSLFFQWSARNEVWSLTIGDGQGVPLFAGLVLTYGTDLLRGYHYHPDCPAGSLFVLPISGGFDDPRLGELGPELRCSLVWEPYA
jgi:hypothetical protein